MDLLGLAHDDLFGEINGMPINSYGDVCDALLELGSVARIDVDLERAGAPLHLTYHLVQGPMPR